MTMPSGFEIAQGYVTVRAKVDRTQIDKSASDAGTSAGNRIMANLKKAAAADKTTAVTIGSDVSKGVEEGFNKRGSIFSRVFKSARRDAERAGDEASKGILSKMKGGLMAAAPAGMLAALMPAMLSAGPILGSALALGLSAALIGGIGVAPIAAGIKIVSDDPRVKSAWDGMKKSMGEGLNKAAASFVQPVLNSIKIFQTTFDKLLPSLTRVFTFVAPYVEKFAQGIADAALKAMPAFERVVMNSGPMLSMMANSIVKIGSGTAAFLNGTVNVFNKLKSLWGGGSSGPFTNLPGIIASVKGLGGTFREVFSSIFKAINDNKAQFQTFFNFVLGFSKALWSGVGPVFKALGSAITGIINILGGLITFFQGVFTGNWKKAGDGLLQIWNGLWNGVKGILTNVGQALINITGGIWTNIKSPFIGFKNWFVNGWKSMWTGAGNDLSRIGNAIKNTASGIWNGIKSFFTGFKNWFVGGWSSLWTGARNTIVNMGNAIRDGITSRINTAKNNISTAISGVKNTFASLRDTATSIFNTIGSKITAFKNNAVRMFQLARDGIGTAWNGIKDKVKQPVNYVINPVYSSLRNMWNKAATVIPGIKDLPEISRFAQGGMVGSGVGRKDTVPAMLTRGEAVLTTGEVAKLGGPKGFSRFRNELQYYNDGGIVGGIKDWVGGKLKAGKDKVSGLLRGSLYGPAKALADEYIFPAINKLSNSGFAKLPRQGASNLVNGALNWLKKDDKANAAPSGSAGMGYKKMMEILRSKFPGLPMISGPRPGSVTLSGNRSYHASGRAVDVKPSAAIAKFIHDGYKNITKELITPYQQYNLRNGKSKHYTGAVWNQHNYAGGNAHTHWAADRGAAIPPKSTAMLTNATSSTEFALTKEHLKDVAGDRNYYVTFNVHADDIDDVRKVKEALAGLGASFDAGYRRA